MGAQIGGLRADHGAQIGGVRAELGEARVGLGVEIAGVRAEIHASEARLIRWIVGTTLASASLAFTIAKFVH
jgi:hypothetical protein